MKRLLAIPTMLLVRPKNWLSWVLGVIVAIAMTIIVVPGTPVWPEHQRGDYVGSGVPPRVAQPADWTVTLWSDQAPAPEAPIYAEAHDYSHGWPMEWMRQSHCFEAIKGRYFFPGESCWFPLPKTPTGENAPAIAWATDDAWPWSGDYQWLRIGVLLLDLGMALIIVLLVTRLFDLWLTHRRPGWSLRLTELLLATAVSCVVLGWWQYHVRLQKEEAGIIGEYEKNSPWRRKREAYCGPVWLGKLIGNPAYLPFCVHRVEQTIGLDDISDEKLKSMKKLTFLTRITLDNQNPRFYVPQEGLIEMLDAPEMVSYLKGFRYLRQINFEHRGIVPELIPLFFTLKNVDRFNVDCVGMPAEEYQQLRQLDSRVLAVSSEESGFSRRTRPTADEFLLDLSGREVARDDLEKFTPALHRINELKLGSQVDFDALIIFLQDRPKTFCISFGEFQLTREQLLQLFTSPKERDEESQTVFEVRFQQAELSAADLTEWASLLDARRTTFSLVRLLNSNLSGEAISSLQSEFYAKGIDFVAYRGMTFDDSQLIGPPGYR